MPRRDARSSRRPWLALLLAAAVVSLVPALTGAFAQRAIAATGWSAVAPMPAARTGATTTLLPNGQVLVAGGMDATSFGVPQATAYLFNPVTQSWTQTASMHTARAFGATVLLPNGTVLVAGGSGVSAKGAQSATAAAEVFNPATATWTPVAAMHNPRDRFTATVLGSGKVLVTGGENAPALLAGNPPGINLTAAELYDPSSQTWTVTGSMQQGRDDHIAALLPSGDVLVEGGYRGGHYDPGPTSASDPMADSEVYVVATGQWRITGDSVVQHQLDTATPLPDGRVLLVGGFAANIAPGLTPTTPDVEIYNPTATDPATGQQGSWAPAAPLPSGRAEHAATLLADGRVLVSGGEATTSAATNTPTAVSSAVLYDPGTDSWSDAGSMLTPRSAFAAVRLSVQPCGSLCNDVLVAGGADTLTLTSGASTAAAEVFTPTPLAAGSLGPGSATSASGVPVPDTGTWNGWLVAGGAALVAGGLTIRRIRSLR